MTMCMRLRGSTNGTHTHHLSVKWGHLSNGDTNGDLFFLSRERIIKKLNVPEIEIFVGAISTTDSTKATRR
jgi:hypothetical protein